MPECGIAGEIMKQDFPNGFVFIADNAQPQEEAAESVFLVVGLRNLVNIPVRRSRSSGEM